MSNALLRIGRWSVHRRHRVVGLWIVIGLSIVISNRVVGGVAVDDFSVPDVESQTAADLLDERFPERSGATAMVVFHADGGLDEPARSAAVTSAVEAIRELPDVLTVTDPLASPLSVSQDRGTAFASVQYERDAAALGRDALDELDAIAASARAAGIQVELGGELANAFKEESTGHAEAVGILAALAILFVTFRRVTAAAMPVVTAMVGVAIGLSLVGLVGSVIDIPSVAPKLGTMIGLGVGIDYALFVISRHRDELGAGFPVDEAAARTNATAGSAVVVAGMTVVVAILGLQVAGIPFVAALGYAAAIVVAVAVAVAVTLTPALLGFAGNRIRPRPLPTGEHDGQADAHPADGWMRWARRIATRPLPWAAGATIILLALAVPTLDLQLGQADAGSAPSDSTRRRSYDLLAGSFGEGFNGPLLVTVDLTASRDPAALDTLAATLRSTPGVRAVSPPQRNTAGDTAILTVLPTTKPQDRATTDLVHALRDDVLPAATAADGMRAYVGGPTARFIDQSDRITARLPWFIGAVVAVSFLLLLVVFRSVLVPLKAAALNLLAIGAAYGVVVAVFQWGWGRSLIGLDTAVPIASFVPMMMFAILFGLSMDYEVFILSRIREEHDHGSSTTDSIVHGLGATAKVITAAALIMVSVFLGFVASPDPIVKMMGVGLATAVAVDATIVRMILVPATMTLAGAANWWLPSGLARRLPRLHLESPPDADASSDDGAITPAATGTTDSYSLRTLSTPGPRS